MLCTSVKRGWRGSSSKRLTRKRSLRSNRKVRKNLQKSSLELLIWGKKAVISKKNNFLLIRLLTKSFSTVF